MIWAVAVASAKEGAGGAVAFVRLNRMLAALSILVALALIALFWRACQHFGQRDPAHPFALIILIAGGTEILDWAR